MRATHLYINRVFVDGITSLADTFWKEQSKHFALRQGHMAHEAESYMMLRTLAEHM